MPALGWKQRAAAVLNLHPYYPTNLLLPDWQPAVVPYERILYVFFACAAVFLLLTWVLSARFKYLSLLERSILVWFSCDFIIHFIVEGDYVITPKFYADKSGNFLHEIWKEYAKADSRYATRDSFVVCMEAFTAFVEGPGSLLMVYGLIKRASWRYVLAILVSFGELYGCILYFGTSWFEGGIFCRPEAFYLWFYFIFMNTIWVVIPTAIIFWASRQLSAAVSAFERTLSGVPLKEE